MPINNGGSAFPTMRSEVGGIDGMNLRQYYVGQALVGIISTYKGTANADKIASYCVQMADALIKAQEGK